MVSRISWSLLSELPAELRRPPEPSMRDKASRVPTSQMHERRCGRQGSLWARDPRPLAVLVQAARPFGCGTDPSEADEEMTDLQVPDGFEPITAARAWRSEPISEGLRRLKAFGREDNWPRHRPMKAECQPSMYGLMFSTYLTWGTADPKPAKPEPPKNHQAPHALCSCGIWAMYDPLLLPVPDDRSKALVYGIVKLWGRIVCGSDGWRGEYASPAAVVQRSRRRARRSEVDAAATYGIPLLEEWPKLTPPRLEEDT